MIDKVEQTKRNIKRGGKYLRNIMLDAIREKSLSGENTLAIFNTYGVGLDVIVLIAESHGIEVCEKRFEYLLNKQQDELKNSKQCCNENILESAHPM